MQFVIQDYLAQLKERDELDAILPDLLRAMGFQIVKLAFRGEVEHGVDIAAVRREQGTMVLYLFQVKSGDIDARMWDSGANSVRASLNNLLDVPFQDLTQPYLQQATRKAVLVHNGEVRGNVKARFDGYIKEQFSTHMEFDRWGIDRLVRHFQDYLFTERILPKEYQRLLKRTLVFLDVPDYDLGDFRHLMQLLLPSEKRLTKAQRTKLFGFVRLILTMIRKCCQDPDFDDLSVAIATHEYALLTIWGWMWRNSSFGKQVMVEFELTYALYIQLLIDWAKKIAPAVNIPDGLAFGGRHERVEYPMRTFAVIGNLGFLASVLMYMPESEFTREAIPETLTLLMNAIRNNRSRHRPLLDNHSIDIFLGMWPLLLAEQTEFVKWWLSDLLEHMAIRKRLLGRLPELHNRMEAVIEYEATSERPLGYVDSSSLLVYMLFEVCIVLDAHDLYEMYRPHFADISLQVWYPPDSVEEILYSREVTEGDTEIIDGLPKSFDEFRLDVQARQQFDRSDYSPVEKGLPALLLLANKHFRTPVFPFWWRKLTSTNRKDDTGAEGKSESQPVADPPEVTNGLAER